MVGSIVFITNFSLSLVVGKAVFGSSHLGTCTYNTEIGLTGYIRKLETRKLEMLCFPYYFINWNSSLTKMSL